ncbi:hypothetical protein [Gymnodinialimonas sp.]
MFRAWIIPVLATPVFAWLVWANYSAVSIRSLGLCMAAAIVCGQIWAICLKPPSNTFLKLLDYPYYVIGSAGVVIALFLGSEATIRSEQRNQIIEIGFAIGDVSQSCNSLPVVSAGLETDSRALARETCAAFLSVVDPYRSLTAQVIHNNATIDDLINNQDFEAFLSRALGAVQTMFVLRERQLEEGSTEQRVWIAGAHFAGQVNMYYDHQYQRRIQSLQLSESTRYKILLLWPFLISLAMAIKLSKTTWELRAT